MSELSDEAWSALESAAAMTQPRTLEQRIATLERLLDEGSYRFVGTNIVAVNGLDIPDDTLAEQASYSVICGGVTLEEHAKARYSFLHRASIRGFSNVYKSIVRSTDVFGAEITFSDVRDSTVGDSCKVTGSTVRGSNLDHDAVVIDSRLHGTKVKTSRVERSTINSSTIEEGLIESSTVSSSKVVDSSHVVGSEVKSSEIRRVSDVTGSTVEYCDLDETSIEDSVVYRIKFDEAMKLSGAIICQRGDLINLHDLVGTGQHVYAYRTGESTIFIQAGCKEFRSTHDMLQFAPVSPDYGLLSGQQRQRYLVQVDAAAMLIDAIAADWQPLPISLGTNRR